MNNLKLFLIKIKKIVFNKQFYLKCLSLLLIFSLTIPQVEKTFGASSKIINIVSGISNDPYPREFYFSNAKPLTVSVSLQQATEANETIEIDLNNYLVLDGISFSNASAFLLSDPTITNLGTGTGKDLAKKITLKLKEGVSGSFTMGITAHFVELNSSHGDTADIIVTQKQSGLVVGSPQNFTFSLYNDSKPDVYITKSGNITPGGTVTYSVYYRKGRKQRGDTTYAYSSVNPGISYTANTIIPLPNIGVENVQVITPATTNYDAGNNLININASFTDQYVGQFKVKYSDSLTVGTTITGNAPSFSGNTPLLKSLSESDLKAPIAPISDTVDDPPKKSMSFSLLGYSSFLIGENPNSYYTVPEATNKFGLFGFSFNNNSPYDYNNVEIVVPVPDGLKATGFKVPSNNSTSAPWKSTSQLIVEYTKNDDTVVTKTITPNTTIQYFTKTILGLGDNEYIKSFKFKFDKIASGDYTYSHNSAYTVNFFILGYVDTHYRVGNPINDGDSLNIDGRELKLDAYYDADDTDGVNMVSLLTSSLKRVIPYTKTQKAGIAAQLHLVNPVTKATTTNTSFYPNDKGMLRLYLSATSIDYGNTQKLTNPVLWIKIPDSFVLDTSAVTMTSGYLPATLSIDSVSEVTGTSVPNGYKLYRIKTNGYLVSNAPNNANTLIYTNAYFYIPFTVNKYAPPTSYDTSFANSMYYIGSDEQSLSGYSLASVADTYKFQGSTTTRNLIRVESPSYNFIPMLNIIGSGFQMFHQIKSDYGGVYKPSYKEGDTSTLARFTNTQTQGTLQVQFANNDSQPVEGSTFVYYETLPKGSNSADTKVVLNGPVSYTDLTDNPLSGTGFKVLYSTAQNPERNQLTGGTDTSYLEQVSITDWSTVTGFKIITTQNIAGATTIKFNFPVKVLNPTAYGTIAVGPSSEYRVAIVGGAPLTKYETSELAASTIDIYAVLSGKVYYDRNRDGINDITDQGINGINIELYKVGSPDTLASTYSTKNGGTPSATDGYYEFININPGTYYLKTTVDDKYSFTSNTVNISGNRNLTHTSDTTNKKAITTSQSFDLVATNNFSNINIGMVIHPKIVPNPTVATNGVTLEKVYDDKSDQDFDAYFKSFVTVFDKAVQISDLSNVTIDYGDFKDNMKKNGILGDYPIKLTYTNEDNDTTETTIIAKIVDTKAPTITTTQETYSFSVNASAPSGSWEDYITSNFNIDNAQDDFIESNLVVDFGTFDPSVVGTYIATASYTDANGNVSVKNKVTINVQRTTPVITPNDSDLNTNGITLEKVTDIKSDYDSFFRSLVTLVDEGYPDLSADDLDIIGVDELSAAMEKNGALGNYVIAYDAENSDGGRSSYSIIVKVVDTTPATIDVTNTELSIDQDSDIPNGFATWEEYIYNTTGITITDDQDDVINDLHLDMPFDMQIGLGNFNPNVPGLYTITVDYTDPSTAPSPYGNKSTTQYITFTVKGLPIVTGNNFVIERGTSLGTTQEDKIDFIKSHASIVAEDPMDSQNTLALDVSGVSEIDSLTVGDYITEFKYASAIGETTLQVTISVVDTIKPVIALKSPISLKTGEVFATPKAYIEYATDTDIGGGITDLIDNVAFKIYDASGIEVSEVSTDEITTYKIVYSLDDGNGNEAEQKTLDISVVPNSYSVKWVLNNEENDIEYSIQSGEQVQELLNVLRPGYNFDGWYEDESFTKKPIFPIQNIGENKVFYAKWDVIIDNPTTTYKIKWILNNGDYDIINTVLPGQLVEAITNITRKGFNFNGWYENDSFTIPALLPINSANENKIFYAKWTKKEEEVVEATTYKIKWVLNNGQKDIINDFESGLLINAPSDIFKSGYDFDGWYQDESFTKRAVFPILNDKVDKVFYARWIRKNFSNSSQNNSFNPKNEDESQNKVADNKDSSTLNKTNNTIKDNTQNKNTSNAKNTFDKPDFIFKDGKLITISEILYSGPYINGYPDKTIKPEGILTRAEAVQVIYNLYGKPDDFSNINDVIKYTDVKQSDWYAKALAFLTKYNLISGYPDGTFAPNKPITRAELVTLLLKYSNTDKDALNKNIFNDVSEHWAKQWINLAFETGIIKGYPDGTFKPNNLATRAEMVVIINTMMNRPDEWIGENTNTDLDNNQWTFKKMMNASKGYVE